MPTTKGKGNIYTLKEIHAISFQGFLFEIPEETVKVMNFLCADVGSPPLTTVRYTPRLQVQEKEKDQEKEKEKRRLVPGSTNLRPDWMTSFVPPSFSFPSSSSPSSHGAGAGAGATTDWQLIRSFQSTKIEHNTGIQAEMDQLRLMLNKLTDKTFLDLREKILAKLQSIHAQYALSADLVVVSDMLFQVCSSNKFYSKVFADMFAEMASMHEWIMKSFHVQYDQIMQLYRSVEYVDADVNYDGFCDMNKENEKRRAVTLFYVHLSSNGFIGKAGLLHVLKQLMFLVTNWITLPNKKNEVDELSELIALLFQQDIPDQEIKGMVVHLSRQKTKDYISLSNKCLFKFMDLSENM